MTECSIEGLERGTPILVTTDQSGVFCGRFNRAYDGGRHISLFDARNCVYWDKVTKGFLGLARNGPGPGCRVGPKADMPLLLDVTSIAIVTDEAVKQWESEPWS